MAGAGLKAPVGLDPRPSWSKGDAVKNNNADVETVRRMLAANGFDGIAINNKVDGELLKAIAAMQKKAGIKRPDQVIDPGGRTEKAMVAKFAAAEKDRIAGENMTMMEVKYKGKILMLTPKDHKMMRDEVFKKLSGYISSLLKTHKNNMDTYQHYIDTARLKEGVLNAVAQAIIMQWRVTWPSSSLAGRSIQAAGALERAVSQKSLTMLDTALPEAERAINAFSADVMRFLREFTGSAKTTGTVLAVGSAACFMVVGALAGPVIVTATGMTATKAAIVSGGGVSVLKSATEELGKHASGQNVTAWDSLKSIAVDGTIGALSAGIANKLPKGFIDKIAKGLAPKVAAKIPFMTAAQAGPFIQNYLSGSGMEVLKSAVSESLTLVGKAAKSGKAPTEKDWEDWVQNIVFSALAGGLMKNLENFHGKWGEKGKSLLTQKIVPELLSSKVKGNELSAKDRADIIKEVVSKVSESTLKLGYDMVIKQAKGDEDANKLVTMVTKQIEKDRQVQNMVDAEIKKALKKRKIPVK